MDETTGTPAQGEQDWLALRFEQARPRLHAVARRLVGSTGEADDAVQEAWIRLSRSEVDRIENLEAWLVTTVGRVALNQLRSRSTRAEAPLEESRSRTAASTSHVDPEEEALLVDSVGIALQVVLDTLTPAERLAYVLHDMFAVPFDQVAGVLDRSPESARQLASRSRRRIRGLRESDEWTAEVHATDEAAEWDVVEAFLAAARGGDFDALLAVLDPDVVHRVHAVDGAVTESRGARAVAGRARAFTRDDVKVIPARVDGQPGWVAHRDGELYSVGLLTVEGPCITSMDIVFAAAGADLDVVPRDDDGPGE